MCEQTELPTSPIGLKVLPATQRSESASSVSQGAVFKSESSHSNSKFGKKVGEIVAALDKEQILQHPLAKSSSGAESTSSKNLVKPEKAKKMDYYGDQASLISFSGLTEPCSIGSIVEVVINSQGEMQDSEDVTVFAESPTGRRQPCNIVHQENSFTATFTPSEIGEWKIGILYNEKHIKGSPFVCQVYDPNLVRVYGLDMGLTGHEVKFTVDASEAGAGDLRVSILRQGKQIQHEIEEETFGSRRIPVGKYQVHFTPVGAGQYKIHIAYNNMEVKGEF